LSSFFGYVLMMKCMNRNTSNVFTLWRAIAVLAQTKVYLFWKAP
jgi:hypothetical protein